jgi:hypothetical protein
MAWKIKAWILVDTDESLVFDDWKEANRHREELGMAYPNNIYELTEVKRRSEEELLLLPEGLNKC